MACFSCRSENVKAFNSEISIHIPGETNLTQSVRAFPKLLVCLDCGLADVLLSQDELRNLTQTVGKPSNPRDMNVNVSPESSVRDQ